MAQLQAEVSILQARYQSKIPQEEQPPHEHGAEWLTATEAAMYLRIKPRTILLWARQGHIRGYRLSGTRRVTWRFLRTDLDATLTSPSVVLTKRRIR
jgi:excisionase family DNA binding protein